MEDLWKRVQGENLSSCEWTPPVDISENESQVLVAVELPGVDVKDIDICVTGDMITLKGEKRKSDHLEEHPHFCREIHSGRFQRSFRLPAAVEGENVAAQLKNGILTMVIPKSATSDSRRIGVIIAR